MAKKPPPKKTPASNNKKKPLNASSAPAARGEQSTASAASSSSIPVDPVALKDQQRLLNIFAEAFRPVLTSGNFEALLQEIKTALFHRDFDAAFGREDYLEAYAARWSPTRALCYASVFLGIRHHLDVMPACRGDSADHAEASDQKQTSPAHDDDDDDDDTLATKLSESTLESPQTVKMLSIGGCAAEHLAFASYVHHTGHQGSLTLLDSAPWSQVVSLLQKAITQPPELSKYASAAAKASNQPLVDPSRLSFTFTQHDVLSLTAEQLQATVGAEPLAVTMMFTLNELYTNGGIGKTTKFLTSLGDVLPNGSVLLVVDSPGSYSEASLGKDKKRYPMQWLLDHTLLETESPAYKWEKLESEDSVWFRLPEGLSYPIPLENMRYQMHLYRVAKIS